MQVKLDCASTEKDKVSLRQHYEDIINSGHGLEKSFEWLDNEDEILKKAPLLDRNNIKGWKAIFQNDGGWLAAAKAINSVGEVLKAKGVKFGFGECVEPRRGVHWKFC
jgi:sarcosine oxidase / L-pipecolate oxidase